VICCVDVDYQATGVTTACVGFAAWTDEVAQLETVARTPGAAAGYQPGQFYQRELPYLVEILRPHAGLEAIVIDGYVWLDGGRPGLGAHLHAARGEPVIGVAKTAFAGAAACEVVRGASAKPLYITAVGIEPADAAAAIAGMHGPHRIPTLIKRADTLARSH
jgi:deoxyribonuclease V